MLGSAGAERSNAAAWSARQRQDTLARSAREIFPDIDVLCTVSSLRVRNRDRAAPLHAINTNENLIGLVNRNGVSIHHVVKRARIFRVAFILNERASLMVNRWFAAGYKAPSRDV